MASSYASNADAVSDYLKNYTDTQIEGMEDMTDQVANLKDLSWKQNAEDATAQAQGKAEEGGEILGAMLGIKGLGAGYKKLKGIYDKAQEVKKQAKALKDKVSGKDDEFDGFGDDAPKDVGDDVGKDDTFEGFGEDDFNSTIPDEDTYHTAPHQTDEAGDTAPDTTAPDSSDLGENVEPDTGQAPEATSTGDDVDFDNLGDTSVEDIGAYFRRTIAQGRQAIRAGRQKIQQDLNDIDNAGDDAPNTGEKNTVDLDDIFDKAEGGTEEGQIQAIPEAVGRSGVVQAPRVGEGDVEDILSRPQRPTATTEPEQTTGDDDVGNAFAEDAKPSVGGSAELDTYGADVPESYTVERPLQTFKTSAEPDTAPSSDFPSTQASDFDSILQDQGGGRSLGSTFTRGGTRQTFDIDQPDIVDRPGIEPVEQGGTGLGEYQNPLFERPDLKIGDVEPTQSGLQGSSITADQEGVQSTADASKLAPKASSYGDTIDEGVSSKLSSFTQEASSKISNIAGKGISDVGADVGDALATGTGELGAEIGADTLAGIGSAIPVVGEALGVGFGLYEGIKGLIDLFEPSKKTPPKPKLIGGVQGGANPLQDGSTSLTAKLASGIPGAGGNDMALDMSGVMSF